MSSSTMFVLSMIVIVLGVIAWKIPPKKWVPYFKTRTGLGILKGIVLAVAFGFFAVVLSGCSGATYFNDTHVFAGIDSTKGVSAHCEAGGVSDKLTSNLGIKGNLLQSEDKRYRLNGKYTHNSCVLNEDRNGYDGAGVELEYKLW